MVRDSNSFFDRFLIFFVFVYVVDTLKFVKLPYCYPNILSFIDGACARNIVEFFSKLKLIKTYLKLSMS
ncbi:transmembrane protein, putative [Medicago truncatula]|uniref:Transmembrane protein, putative n=1 Tax=Medicago truncatula TaxID=3880 RepID=G7I3N9_MEDTR|nr:transmembrane protein, putative [Medicago truncatula]